MEIVKAFVTGVVLIGLATALFLPDRQTAKVTTAVFNGATGLLKTAETGK